MSSAIMSVYTIYDHPLDFPDSYVVREFEIGTDMPDPKPVGEALLFSHLELARDAVQKLAPGAYCVPRNPDDDPVILETWL